MARGTLLDVALGFKRMVVGPPTRKPLKVPTFRVEGAGSAKLPTLLIVGHTHAAMASLAKRL
jgi:hypothetical protein